MNTMKKEAEKVPAEVELLLPWHAAGTLSRRDAARVEQPEQRGRGRHLDDLGFGGVGGRASADGEPHLGPRVSVMAVNNDLHGP